MPENPRVDLQHRIDAIEAGYEFLLAYAAQGRESDRGSAEGQNVRQFLSDMERALDGLGEVCRAVAEAAAGTGAAVDDYCDFLDAVDSDARKVGAIVRLVLGRPDISSQLVDNLNASVHVRALLTDLFVIDEAL
jgi:hypothetical protein